jgi:cyclophilin family peptidyl-prolyl cis-trans isomerase
VLRRTAWVATAASLALGACGKDDPKPGAPGPAVATGPLPPGTRVDPDVPSADEGIAQIQQKIRAWTVLQEIDRSKDDWKRRLPLRPTAVFDPSKTYLWALETSEGPLRVRLFPDRAPKHVANTVYLTLLGYYDGLTIHRVVPGKAAEGGCPFGDGAGGPGYGFDPEIGERNRHDRRGLVSALGNAPTTDDAKFRLGFEADASLDATATVYGEVEDGLDVLARIEALGSAEGKPSKRIVIQRAEIRLR